MPSPKRSASTTKEARFSLKDHLFNAEKVAYLAQVISTGVPDFDKAGFQTLVMKSLLDLELKARITHIATCLESYLDSNFRVTAQQLIAALPPPLDPNLKDNDFGDFIFAPLGEWVVRNGLTDSRLSLSLRVLHALTQRFSMEFAVRECLRAYPQETIKLLNRWALDPNYHVRRVVSEATRPNLPWAPKLTLPRHQVMPLLDHLHADSTRFVTRSVANHMNDLSKLDPEYALATLERWQSKGRQTESEWRWLAKHALRTLVKQGDARALEFLGFRSDTSIQLKRFKVLSPVVRMGESLHFELELLVATEGRVLIDYEIDFLKSGGKRSQKVHKLKQIHCEQPSRIILQKKHPLRANATTYKLYPGKHHVAVQVNGQILARRTFLLESPE